MRRATLTVPLNGTTRPVFRGGILYVDGAADFLNTTEKAIRAKVARHVLPFRRLGGRIVFLQAELEQFVAALPGVSLEEAKQNVAMRSGEVNSD